MEPVNTKPPSGMRDFLAGEVRIRHQVLTTLRGVFESYGFGPLETPALERLEILQGKYGDEGDRLIFKVMQRGAKAGEEPDMALRYDLTVPLARVVAEHQARLGKIFKRYQMAPVWRADRPGGGRFREFYQCDVDTIGVSFGLADAETILVLTDALAAVGLTGFEVRLNSRKVLHGLIDGLNIEEAREADVLTALDKLDKIGPEGVVQELEGRGVPAQITETLLFLVRNPNREKALRERVAINDIGRDGLEEVDRLTDLVAPRLKEGRITFTPWLARGLSYYTGPIFEIYHPDSGSAIASGGRYDGLVGMFAGRSIPACGGSLGIERIIPLVAATTEDKPGVSAASVLVTVWDENFRKESLSTAARLRQAGIATEVYLGTDRVGEQLGYASSRGIPFAVLCGPKEANEGSVTVRDLGDRSQVVMPAGDLAGYLAGCLAGPR
jgi:histidyl-tRNA synthetase